MKLKELKRRRLPEASLVLLSALAIERGDIEEGVSFLDKARAIRRRERRQKSRQEKVAAQRAARRALAREGLRQRQVERMAQVQEWARRKRLELWEKI